MENERDKEYIERIVTIHKEYAKKIRRKIFPKYVCFVVGFGLLSMYSIGKSPKGIDENTPLIHQYSKNQQTIKYLRREIEIERSGGIPEFVSDEIRSELEKVSTPVSEKYSALEKSLTLAQRDSAEIVNNVEYIEDMGKKQNQERKNTKLFWTSIIGMFSIIPLFGIESYFRFDKPQKRELNELKKYYERE